MSRDRPKCGWKSARLLLAVLALLSLAIFFAWTTTKRARSSETATFGQPDTGMAGTAWPAAPSNRSAKGTVGAQPTSGQPSTQRILKYGHAAGEIGMVIGKEQSPVGPESFAVGKDGTILVADVVNQRVVVYSSNGAFLRSMDLPGIALGDVMTDGKGRVYVYDQVTRALHLYDADGTPRNTLNLNPADIDTRGYFHVSGNAVYFADAAERDVLVATLQDGALVAPGQSLARTTDGIHGESGRIYSMSLDKGQALRLQVRDPGAQPAIHLTQVPVPGIVSARYAGEDETQRFYVQTERLVGKKVVLEVVAFTPTGEPLATTQMPENDYAIWTAKLVDVAADGTIVQFLPEQDQAKLNFFTN